MGIQVKIVCLSAFLITCVPNAYSFDQRCDYVMDASLDVESRVLRGKETISYHNDSESVLHELFFEMYPNCFRPGTKWWETEERDGSAATSFPFWFDESSLRVTDMRSGGEILATAEAGTYLKADFPNGIAPGSSVEIEASFVYKIPRIIDRGGYYEGNFHLIRWYPMVAVYDCEGWHTDEHIRWGEFYGNFGNYDVSITLDENYTIASSGVLAGSVNNGDGTKTERYVIENAHNFAFCADRRYKVASTEYQGIAINFYYFIENGVAERVLNYALAGMKYYSEHYGEYAYKQMNIAAASVKGIAMEYPGLVMIDRDSFDANIPGPRSMMETGVVHEIGHNWWYGAVGNNEFKEAWLDEGLNSFSVRCYMEDAYGKYANYIEYPSWLSGLKCLPNYTFRELDEDAAIAPYLSGYEQPVIQSASEYPSEYSYMVTVYETASLLIDKIRDEIGRDTFDEFLKTYYSRFKFRHPRTEDFISVLGEVTGKDWNPFFTDRFAKALSKPEDFKGLNDSYQGGLRYSVLPDSPRSDETVLTVLPFPLLSFADSDYGIGMLFSASRRSLDGISGSITPSYMFTTHKLGLDYMVNFPFNVLKRPILNQGVYVSGTEDGINVALSTTIGPKYGAYPNIGFALFDAFYAGVNRFSADIQYVDKTLYSDVSATLSPFYKFSFRLNLSLPIYWRLIANLSYQTGWTNAAGVDDQFKNLIFGAGASSLPEYQSIRAGLSLPVFGDIDWYLLREFLKLTGLKVSAGIEAYVPYLISRLDLTRPLHPDHAFFFSLPMTWFSTGFLGVYVTPTIAFPSLTSYAPEFHLSVSVSAFIFSLYQANF
jgi:hypothetical protein